MRWEERILDLFEDLEQQAEGLALAERDALVAEQGRAEYAEVDLTARLHASLGTRLLLDVAGEGALDATLLRVGDGWCLLAAGRHEWIVVLSAISSVRGLVDRGVPSPARPLTARLGLASALRGVAEERDEVVLHRVDGALVRGPLGRVGADFVEVVAASDTGVDAAAYVEVVPFWAVAAVRSG